MSHRQSSLWDSDVNEDILHKVVNLGSSKSLISKKSTLFDSDSDDCIAANRKNHVPTQAIDTATNYKLLYEIEVTRNKDFEAEIAKLRVEITEMKKLMSVLDEKCEDNRTILLNTEVNQIQEDNHLDALRTAEWEALAKEEKQRRQQKLRAVQAKQRTVNASKRLVGGSSSNVAFTKVFTDASITQSASTGSFSTLGDVADSSAATGNESCSQTVEVKPSPVAASSHYLDSSDGEQPPDCSPRNSSPVPTIEEEDAARADEDPEAAKWKELAAQERLRKAKARRSVRVMCRDMGSSVGEERGGVTAPVVKHRHLRRKHLTPLSGALQSAGSSIVCSSNILSDITATTAQAQILQVHAGTRKPSSADSGWEDSSSDSESSDFSSAGEVVTQHFHSVAIEATFATEKESGACVTVLSAAEEAEMDYRLRRWAAGRGIAALLASAPEAMLSSVEAVSVTEVRTAVAALTERGGSGNVAVDIRKAYMKVIRCCHPDKHMALPPRCAAFLELQKIFTVLSEAYNVFKASERP